MLSDRDLEKLIELRTELNKIASESNLTKDIVLELSMELDELIAKFYYQED